MTAKSIKWSAYQSKHFDRATMTTINDGTVKRAIAKSRFSAEFKEILEAFQKKANRFEIVDIHWWVWPRVYIGIKDDRWQHYPCYMRALASFDLTDGKLASYDSDNQYSFARHGWGAFMDCMCGYLVRRYSDCGNRDKTEFC